MNDVRSGVPRPEPGPEGGPLRDDSAARVDHDLRAFAEVSTRNLPGLDRSITAARRRANAAPRWEEHPMTFVASYARRPWFAVAGVAALLVVAALVVPISYEKTTGTDVRLTLANVNNLASTQDIAREMKSLLGAEHVMVEAEPGADVTLAAFVPKSAKVDAGARVEALARELNARGFDATAAATPHREQVSGSVYAYARDLVIKVETEGKTASQIESEIKSQLAAAGITNTTVTVTDQGKERQVIVKAENHDPNAPSPENVTLQLTKNGEPVKIGDGFNVQERKLKSADGLTLDITVNQNGKQAHVAIPHADTMTDAALQSAIQTQLQAAGIKATVEVTNGVAMIRPATP